MYRIMFGLLTVMSLGCGETQRFAKVSGQVTLDGVPLPNGVVTFQPLGEGLNVGPGSAGKTDADGRYTLQVVQVAEQPGALIGKHRVEISAGTNPGGADDTTASNPERVPPQYNRQTTLTFEVLPTGHTNADFRLTTR